MRLRPLALILTLAFGLLGALPADAQTAGPGKVGFLLGISPPAPSAPTPLLDAFRQRLRDLGWVEGRNLGIELRWAEGKRDRLPGLAAELVRLKVDIILTVGTPTTRAAQRATTTIPIVMVHVADPVESGFVASLARPGGNVTGVSNAFYELSRKVVELLTEAVPGASRVAYLWKCASPPPRICHRILEEIQTGAQALGVALEAVRDTEDFAGALAAIKRMRADALIVLVNPYADRHRARIIDFALTHRLPLMAHGSPFWVEAGALISYRPDYPAQFRRAAHLVDKILKGAKPADLPVELPTTFNLKINMNTANALGLTIPSSVLIRADKVID